MSKGGGRIRGTTNIKVRAWGSGKGKNFRPYKISQYEWISRLNYLREKLGNYKLATRLGVSTSDPTYKTIRRWASGDRIPSREIYEEINYLYSRHKPDLIALKTDVEKSILTRVFRTVQNKVNLFYRASKTFVFIDPAGKNNIRRDKNFRHPTPPIYKRMVDGSGRVIPEQNRAVVMISYFENNKKTKSKWQKMGWITREDRPSISLLKNAIDSFIERFPYQPDYLEIIITGVWFTYVS